MRKLDIGVKRLALPLQDNYCDCGLFLLTYTDYFTHSLPAAIRTKNKKTLEPPDLEGRGFPIGIGSARLSKCEWQGREWEGQATRSHNLL